MTAQPSAPRCRKKILPSLKARWDESMPVGNEGGGVVGVAAGESEAAQALNREKPLECWVVPCTEVDAIAC